MKENKNNEVVKYILENYDMKSANDIERLLPFFSLYQNDRNFVRVMFMRSNWILHTILFDTRRK